MIDTKAHPDMQQAARFLEALDPNATAWTFQTFDDNNDRKSRALVKVLHGTFEQHANTLAKLNARGAGIFVTMNETDGSGKREAHNIVRVRALVADFDQPDPRIPERLRAEEMQPSMTVESSPGKFHAYWLVDGVELGEFRKLQKGLIAHWGADPAVHDLPRVMRLPGFLHQKKDPHLVRLLEASARRYGHELLNYYRTFADATQSPATASHEPQNGQQNMQHDKLEAYAAKALESACRVVEDAAEGTRNNTLNSQAFCIGQLVAGCEIPKALARDALLEAAKVAGLTESEAKSAISSGFRAGAKHPRTAPTSDDIHLLENLEAETEPQRCNLVSVDLSNLMTAEIPPTDYVVRPFFPRRHVTLLAAHGGTGKSSLALALAAHVASGKPWAGFQVKHGRALVVSLEDDADVCRGRLRAAVAEYKLDHDAVACGVALLDGTEGESALMTEDARLGRLVPTRTMRELREAAHGFDLILIDNASEAFDGNENSRRDVKVFIRALAKIARANNAAVVLLAHIDKAAARQGDMQGNTFSGSTAWHNSARSRLAMVVDNAGIITLVQEKLNLGKKHECAVLLTFKGAVLMPLDLVDELSEGVSTHDRQAAQDADDVYRLLELAISDGMSVTAAENGPVTTWHALEPMPEMGRTWRTKEGKKRFRAALVRLRREGRIISEGYQKNNRHTGMRWRLVQTSVDDEIETLI